MIPDDFSHVNLEALHRAGAWQNQYRLLIEWGQKVQRKEALRQEQHRIKGCTAPAWLACSHGYVHFDSDSQIMKGLVAVLLSTVTSNAQAATSAERQQSLQQWLTATGLERHLTPSRSNGLKAVMARLDELLASRENPAMSR